MIPFSDRRAAAPFGTVIVGLGSRRSVSVLGCAVGLLADIPTALSGHRGFQSIVEFG